MSPDTDPARESDPGPGPGAETAARTSVPRAAFDVVRLGYAVGAGITSAAITLVVYLVAGGGVDGDALVTALFAFSAAWSLAYLVHTLAVFRRLDAAQLAAALRGSAPRGRASRIGAVISGTAPTIAVQWSIIAIAAVLVFTLWPGLLTDAATVWFSVLVVASSWGVTVVAYAVHYARFDAERPGIEFPGASRARVFMDYLYLAVQVQTTFGTSDVNLTEPSARGLVTGHTLVSFAFNTVIIAMLITVLFLGQ